MTFTGTTGGRRLDSPQSDSVQGIKVEASWGRVEGGWLAKVKLPNVTSWDIGIFDTEAEAEVAARLRASQLIANATAQLKALIEVRQRSVK